MTRTIVSEFERNVMRANVMVSDVNRTIAQGQGGTGGKRSQVSEGYTLAIAEPSLTITQPQTRSAPSGTNETTILY